MKLFRFVLLFSFLVAMAGCSALYCKKDSGRVLPGTDTVLVGIYIDKNGYPQATVDEAKVHPGQKVVFVGPEKFDILFKDQKSPIDRIEVSSVNGVITIEIPRDIFSRQKNSAVAIRELVYRYGIRANGNTTDPSIHVEPE